jgi:hypothetical protein
MGLVVGVGFLLGRIVGAPPSPRAARRRSSAGFGIPLPLWAAPHRHARRSGLRDLDAYPHVRRLREAGWSDPV